MGEDDYHINRRLSEIAGVRVRDYQAVSSPTDPKYLQMCNNNGVGMRDHGTVVQWDPLHDWSQLGPLVEMFVTQVTSNDDAADKGILYCVTAAGFPNDVCEEYGPMFARGPTLPDLKRAAALAIVYAHEEE